MRKSIILLCLLLFAGSAFAQTFPGSLAGDQIPDGVVQEFQMYLYDFHDRDPWSAPNLVGRAFWFGWLEFGVCTDPGTVQFSLTTFSTRRCTESPWGLLDPDNCKYYHPRSVTRAITLPWNPECECYLLLQEWTWGWSFESITLEESNMTGQYKAGYFTLEGTEFKYNYNYSIRTYSLAPRTVEQGSPILRSLRRRLINGKD